MIVSVLRSLMSGDFLLNLHHRRTKQHREEAISLQQAVTSERALRHAAWGMKKSLTAQMQLLDRNPALLPTRKSKWAHTIAAPVRLILLLLFINSFKE